MPQADARNMWKRIGKGGHEKISSSTVTIKSVQSFFIFTLKLRLGKYQENRKRIHRLFTPPLTNNKLLMVIWSRVSHTPWLD